MGLRLILWLVFGAIVTIALFVDMGWLQSRRKAHAVSMKEGLLWTAVWMLLALGFAGVIYQVRGAQRALEFVTGYIVEQSLSIDNMFVFILIFKFFRISDLHQPRILKYGILSAMAMRLIIIFTGVALLQRFHVLLYVFGAFLLFTAVRLFFEKEESLNPGENPVLRFFRRFMPVTGRQQGDAFVGWEEGRRVATPLLAALVVVEASDLIFAIDSIPAVLAISRDPFIVFTSNIFAILGLRSLYFVVHGFMRTLIYLKYGLSFVLIFIGAKMLLMDVIVVPIGLSLAIVAGILGASVIASLLKRPISHES